MYRAILVPVDGSPLGERPLPYVRLIARAAGATIKLIDVLPRSGEARAQRDAGEVQLHHAVETYLADLVRRAAGDLDVETIVVEGDPATEIVQAAQEGQADLIVVSTHGRSGFGRWIYGSVADALLRQAPTPVLLVPAGRRFHWPDSRSPRSLVPLDSSAFAEAVLDPADELAETLRAELVLVRVVEPRLTTYVDPTGHALVDPTQELAGAAAYLEGIATRLRSRSRVVGTMEDFGGVAEGILNAARESEADLIAMTTHGRDGLSRVVLGSHASSLVQRADVPLLLVRPGATGHARAE
jgi:nucleotide-binding universal stress UspA family protein